MQPPETAALRARPSLRRQARSRGPQPLSRAARGRGDDACGPAEPVPRRLLALACSAASRSGGIAWIPAFVGVAMVG
ncbi:hypothetical protein FRC97_12090 [Paracidovorax citrulli]|nr:hypothetical protein FRC75_13100 [Paracidovorax citrulli]UMT87654.1 hypothetical protein FRC90_05930 [Paracidovorax citrulli]UMT95692.1 hypothetical protein FRC97_12090 [Paracidovorax citrulli]